MENGSDLATYPAGELGIEPKILGLGPMTP